MKPERWEQVKELHRRALEEPQGTREEFVARESGADEELRREVTRLLGGMSTLGAFLEPPTDVQSDGASAFRPASFNFRGTMLGDFELLVEIGQGATGVVYRARQASLGRDAAVKILAAHSSASAERRARFHREALAASKLRHPGVVSIYASGEQDGVLYIAMEFVAGEGLHTTVARRRHERDGTPQSENTAGNDTTPRLEVDDPPVAARLVLQVARGLEHCHQLGITHRDIKPHNILLDEHGEPRIVDFGLARDDSQSALTRTGALAGTLQYMSPEQAQALGSAVDHRTDIYSLGAMLYELLALQPPFGDLAPADVLVAIRNRAPTPVELVNPRVPPALAAICAHALAKRPADRYATAAAFAADLERFLAGERVRAPRPTFVYRTFRSAVHHRRVIAASALLAGVGCLILFAPQSPIVRADVKPTPSELELIQAEYGRLWKRFDESLGKYPVQPQPQPAAGVPELLAAPPVSADAPGKRSKRLQALLDRLSKEPPESRGSPNEKDQLDGANPQHRDHGNERRTDGDGLRER